MKRPTHHKTIVRLQPGEALASVLADLDPQGQVTELDLSALKRLSLEDFQALLSWEDKRRLSLRCTSTRLRATLCRLRLHKLYQVWGTAA